MNSKFTLTYNALEFLKSTSHLILCDDFLGYIIKIPHNKHVYILASVEGELEYYIEGRYKLTRRREARIINKMIKSGWIERDLSIFPEFPTYDLDACTAVVLKESLESVITHLARGDDIVFDN